MDNFAGHSLNFETERLGLRPFEDTDFDLALPFYEDTDFLLVMEGQLPEESITGEYLRRAGEAMTETGVPVCNRGKIQRPHHWRSLFTVDEFGSGKDSQ